jgi:glutaredoxin
MSSSRPTGHHAIYVSRFCGACHRVLNAVDDLGIDIEIRDVTLNSGRRDEIRRATGRRTVPVLRITHPDGRDEWMFQSREIVKYLTRCFGEAA